jgi:D-cysteine desulfhydrase
MSDVLPGAGAPPERSDSSRCEPAANASRDLALFRTYPRLREVVARCPFITAPTPIEPLSFPGLPEGRAFVKRDECSSALYGGNKPRKLEFIIGSALARKSRRLITSGALGTHHGLATAILGRSVGLDTSLVLVPQPITPEVRESLALDAAWGAELVYAPGVPSAAYQTVRLLVRSQLRGERPHLVWTGGNSPLGNFGFVSAALELAEQVEQGALPAPAEIYVPVGTGGTFVGLVVGLALAGLDTRVVGVLVTDILTPSPRRLLATARATLRLMRKLDPAVPNASFATSDFALDRSELGDGYGAPTEAARAALDLAADQGLALETTYSAKCFAALAARAKRRALPDEPVLFWNTFNAVDLVARAPRTPTLDTVPKRIRDRVAAAET